MKLIPATGRLPALLLLAVAVAAAVAFAADPAFAQSSNIFATATTKGCEVFKGARQLFYIGAALGIIALGTLAAFGRFQWKWVFSLVAGVFMIASFGQIMVFLEAGNFASCS